MEYLFIESPTGGGGGTGRRSHSLHEDRSDHVAATPKLSSLCYLRLSPPAQPSPGPPVAPGAPAPADKEGKRETGRTPEGNRCQRYPGFAYREEGGGGGAGFREREINISLDFIVLI